MEMENNSFGPGPQVLVHHELPPKPGLSLCPSQFFPLRKWLIFCRKSHASVFPGLSDFTDLANVARRAKMRSENEHTFGFCQKYNNFMVSMSRKITLKF